MIFLFNNLIQLIPLLVFPLIIFILATKFKFDFNISLKKRSRKIDNSDANNLTLEKILIITFQLLIIILNSATRVTDQEMFTPILILILHTIICFSFLIKSNEKIKFWNNIFNLKFIILITIICSQLLFLVWQIHNIIFFNNNSFFWIFLFNSIFFFLFFKVFNQALLISKYLVFITCKILIAKKNTNLYFKQKQIFNFYSKIEAIANLWNFENLKHAKEMNLTNTEEKDQKIIKNNFIIFIISLLNLFFNNIIKTQKIIINGWKSSLNQ